jgi:hypothetical protein
MKTKIGLIIALGLGLASTSAFAYDRDEHRDENRDDNRGGYSGERHGDWERHGDLERHINHMNKMLAHVRWELSNYRGDWRLRREVDRISEEVNRVNWRFEHRRNRGDIRDDVQRLRRKLHRIEEQLHVRSRDFYRWQD